MQRRTFLMSTAAGAALAAAPVGGAPAASAATAPAAVRTPAELQAATPVTHDIDGQPRGRSRDVGADEYSRRAPRRGPLTPADVGPLAR